MNIQFEMGKGKSLHLLPDVIFMVLQVYRFLCMSIVKSSQPFSLFQASGDRQQVSALYEWLQAKQWLLLSVQFLCLLQPLPPGRGLLDPVGTNCQRVGRGAQKEREAAEGESRQRPCRCAVTGDKLQRIFQLFCPQEAALQQILILKSV